MNEVGAYWDLDMDGLAPAWYEDVPIDVQRRVMSIWPDHRVLFSRRLSRIAVVQRDRKTAQKWADGGFLCGWLINFWWDSPLGSGEDLIDHMWKVDRWRHVGKDKADKQEDFDKGIADFDKKQEKESDETTRGLARDYLSPVLSGSTTMERFGAARRKELEKQQDEESGKRHARRRKVAV